MCRSFKYLTSISAFYLLLMCITGCGKKEAEVEYPRNVDFYIRYMSEGNLFNSLCKLSYADSLAAGQPDTSSYAITVGGKDMKEIIPQSGAKHYNFKSNLPYAPTYEIKIKSRDGKIINQTTKLAKIDSISVPKSISRSKGLTFTYAGAPLTADETIIIMIVTKDGKAASNTVKGPMKTNELMVKAQDLSVLSDGEAEFYLIRTYSEDVPNQNLTFYFRNEFITKTYKVNLIP